MTRISITLLILLSANQVYAKAAQAIAKANKKALAEPDSRNFYNAAMIFDWEPHKLYQIYTKPSRITDIALEAGEKLISVAGGDSQRWTITDSISGSGANSKKHILLKPHKLGISNNLVITTNRRTYHIELHSLANVPYQAVVTWNYPRPVAKDRGKNGLTVISKPSELLPLDGLSLRPLNFRYHFVAKKRPPWMPLRAFDDGQKTYIEFPSSMDHSESPILYALSLAKEQEILNYRRYKNFYIVDHLVNILELAIGGSSPIKVGIEREVW